MVLLYPAKMDHFYDSRSVLSLKNSYSFAYFLTHFAGNVMAGRDNEKVGNSC
jgi:hypothetical protein